MTTAEALLDRPRCRHGNDPIACRTCFAMKGRWVVQLLPPVIVVRGLKAGDRLRNAGLKPLWGTSARGWVLDARHLGDVVAVAENEGISYRIDDTP